ncbi:hypothetical protein TD95_000563 [Thielaviopsis punctulata]|uniref:Uncharacterized protein n=1 Tax=Thielaviopsis punctulata TaxID=72032 RepID=A0A0F4ZKF7_9PEZI|nr:hypothetical protein TD95_000563 [Thielaviopsis punctulata]
MTDKQPNPQDHLEPPAREGVDDPGAHDLSDASADESEDHFSDARSDIVSPVPKSASKLKSTAAPTTDSDDTSTITPAMVANDGTAQESSAEVDNDTDIESPSKADGDANTRVPFKNDTDTATENTAKAISKPETTANDEPDNYIETEKPTESEVEPEPEIEAKLGSEPESKEYEGGHEDESLAGAIKSTESDAAAEPKEETREKEEEEEEATKEPESIAKDSGGNLEPDPESEIQLSFEPTEPDEPKPSEQRVDSAETLEDKHTESPKDEEKPPQSPLPGGFPIPTTVLQESAGSVPPRSPHVEHTHATDASPDLVLRQKEEAKDDIEPIKLEFEDSDSQAEIPGSPCLKPKSSRHMQSPVGAQPLAPPADGNDFDDDFGDFDDFEEGGDDDDFGDFDDAAFQTEPVAAPAPAPAPVSPAPLSPAPPTAALPFPVPDFEGLDEEDIPDALDPYMNLFFPPESLDVIDLPPLTKENTSFLTQRSASLWSQLVAPPPLAPPDWIRSRIRRLFLVSLGVPVDLDEILPASKQKKLVLPSLSVSAAGKSPRTSTDARAAKNGDSATTTTAVAAASAGDASGARTPRTASRRRGEKPAPELDVVSAKQLCSTTHEALAGMTMDELEAHLDKLKTLTHVAAEALEYWKKTTDEKIAERDALEGVIENLVKHARKVRK